MVLLNKPGQLPSDTRRPALATTDKNAKAGLPILSPDKPKSDVMKAGRGAVLGTCRDGNLEFPRQEGKFRMQRGPLADCLAP